MLGLREITKLYSRKRVILMALLLVTVAAAVDAQLPKLMSVIVNDGVMQRDEDFIRHGLSVFFVISVVGCLSSYFSWLLLSYKSLNFEDTLRGKLGAAILNARYTEIETKQGTIITRMTSDISKIAALLPVGVNLLYRPLISTLICFAVVFNTNKHLGVIVLLFFLLQIALVILFVRNTVPLFSKVQKKIDRVNTFLQEIVFNLRLIRVCNAGSQEKDRFETYNCDLRDSKIAALRRISYFNPLVVALMNLLLSFVLLFLGGWQNGDQRAIGNLMMLLAYFEQTLMSVLISTELAKRVAEVFPAVRRVNELLTVEGSESVEGGDVIGDEPAFALQEVSFKTNAGEILFSHINLCAKKGETVGILAPSCSGKTLLSMIMAGDVLPYEGNVLFCGTSLRQIENVQRKRRIAVVLDSVAIFDDTVRNNILLDRDWITADDLSRAIDTVEFDQCVSEMENGLETQLFSNGMILSGGERQKLMIARALAGRPDVLILDNCTTSMDYCTERSVILNIHKLYPDIIVLFITQRHQSVDAADRVFSLSAGGLDFSKSKKE